MAYWTANFPFDTVKSIVQAQAPEQRQSMARVAAALYRLKGVRGFYHGWLMTVLKALPANAALFVIYETSTRMLLSW